MSGLDQGRRHNLLFQNYLFGFRLSHEVSSNYMMSTFTSNPEVLVVEPSFRRSVHIGDGGQIPGDMPRITPNKFTVDMAFGEEDDNNVVYEAVAQPLIDLSLQVRYFVHFFYLSVVFVPRVV